MDFTLLILAGGLGSRFNGSKQLHGIGPNGELLMEYSIHDAIKNGCSKVVILSNHKCIPELKIKLSYLTSKIKVDYVDQFKFDPDYPNYRKRPWGTGHAVLACASHIKGLFMVVNTDDFYGDEAYFNGVKLMQELNEDEFGLIAYRLVNTLSENGGVSRGICHTDNNQLISISECTNIEMNNGKLSSSDKAIEMNTDQLVSMNLWVFQDSIFSEFKKAFDDFYKKNEHSETLELYLPNVINQLIKNHKYNVKINSTNSSWFGLTYLSDLAPSKEKLKNLIELGAYPSILEQ